MLSTDICFKTRHQNDNCEQICLNLAHLFQRRIFLENIIQTGINMGKKSGKKPSDRFARWTYLEKLSSWYLAGKIFFIYLFFFLDNKQYLKTRLDLTIESNNSYKSSKNVDVSWQYSNIQNIFDPFRLYLSTCSRYRFSKLSFFQYQKPKLTFYRYVLFKSHVVYLVW